MATNIWTITRSNVDSNPDSIPDTMSELLVSSMFKTVCWLSVNFSPLPPPVPVWLHAFLAKAEERKLFSLKCGKFMLQKNLDLGDRCQAMNWPSLLISFHFFCTCFLVRKFMARLKVKALKTTSYQVIKAIQQQFL